jgi:ubiquinone/menaquinone biosynthesis C-methylase UbiE
MTRIPVGPAQRALLACVVLLVAGAACAESLKAEADRVAELLALHPGAVVAEIGAGDGEMAVALAERVTASGRVYATELAAEKLPRIAAAARQAGRSNVVVVQAGVSTTGLPDACCDAVLMRYVDHHLTDPGAIDAAILRALRPGGRLLVIDFPPTWYLAPWTPEGVPANRSGHGIRAADAEAELLAAGFEAVEVIEPWRSRFLAPDSFAIEVRRPAVAGAP